MPPDRLPSNPRISAAGVERQPSWAGDDGDARARRRAAEAGEDYVVPSDDGSMDWLRGRMAAIDAHLFRLTRQVDDDRTQRADEHREVMEELRHIRRELRDTDEKADAAKTKATEAAESIEKHAPEWVSTLPPGKRRILGYVAAFLIVVFQVVLGLKADLR